MDGLVWIGLDWLGLGCFGKEIGGYGSWGFLCFGWGSSWYIPYKL